MYQSTISNVQYIVNTPWECWEKKLIFSQSVQHDISQVTAANK